VYKIFRKKKQWGTQGHVPENYRKQPLESQREMEETSGAGKSIGVCERKCTLQDSKRDEVTGEWRRLHNEELNDLYSSPNIIRVINSRFGWRGM
jgi:hypothetical protein